MQQTESGNQRMRAFHEETYITNPTDGPGGFHDGRRELYRQLLTMFERQSGGRLLDIGCYDGYLTQMVAAKVGASEVYGADFNKHILPLAAAKGIVTAEVDLDNQDLPYEDGFFDYILCSEVIEHILSPDHLLAELHRVLKPTGYAVITTPNLASWRNRIMLLVGWQPYWTEVSTEVAVGNPYFHGKPCGHLRVFTARAMRELLPLAGLRVDKFAGMVYGFPGTGVVARVAAGIDQLIGARVPDLTDDMMVRVRRA